MEIINAHAHIYPVKIAEKATNAIGEFYGINMDISAGTADDLIQDGKSAGISSFLVHSVATTAHQVGSINRFIKSEIDTHSQFIGFITLHPDMTEQEISNEINWAVQNGFKGIKLHPDFQKFYIDNERVEKLYCAASGKLPILMHMGDDRYDFSRPVRLVKMAKKYPDVTFIAAHFGGYRCWNEVSVYRGLKNVYFDTSSSLSFISPKRAKEIIDMLGAEKFFFGTDFPMWSATKELDRFLQIPLSEKERRMILAENVKKLLKI